MPGYTTTFEAVPLRADDRTVRAFVTDRRRVLRLDVGGALLALSPRDPDRLVAEVGRGG